MTLLTLLLLLAAPSRGASAARPAPSPAASAAAPAPAARPARPAASLRVCVYHDADAEGEGRLHGVMIENLLGHFREVAPELRPVTGYRPGGLASCDRAAYVGTDYAAGLPAAFLSDVARGTRPFLWVNYNIEGLQAHMGLDAFAAKTGFVFYRWRGFEPGARPGQVPGFYRDFEYKGARFHKSAHLRKDGGVTAAPDIAMLGAMDGRVLATAHHSRKPLSTPYVMAKDGFFYVADDPFLFTHERDRYLITADLMFDFLRLPPRDRVRKALIRLEDVHPKYDIKLLYKVVKTLKKKHVPFAISLIPEYVRPGLREERSAHTLGRRRAFMRALAYAQANGGDILLHGATHNVPTMEHCKSLGSAADYEFWDRCKGEPLPHDSESWARKRLSRAKALMAAAGITPVAWVTPHYAASPVDFRLFGRLFDRTVQRVTYAAEGKPAPGAKYRFINQLFPYTIYRDHYGQFVWPENLGFVPFPGSDWGEQRPEDIAETARLASVVRDGWASFYWHPQLAAVPGELERLEGLVDSLRSRGFTFVSLSELKKKGE